jgi:predicted Ser/Thr protein kinase
MIGFRSALSLVAAVAANRRTKNYEFLDGGKNSPPFDCHCKNRPNYAVVRRRDCEAAKRKKMLSEECDFNAIVILSFAQSL